MKIQIHDPVNVGDLANRHTVAELELVSVSFNLDCGEGKMNASVTLRDKSSGFQVHEVLQDDDELPPLWERVKALELDGERWLCHLLKRLVAQGRLPEGTIS
jgi:hypothetical protein